MTDVRDFLEEALICNSTILADTYVDEDDSLCVSFYNASHVQRDGMTNNIISSIFLGFSAGDYFSESHTIPSEYLEECREYSSTQVAKYKKVIK